jgi:hypothetical protein
MRSDLVFEAIAHVSGRFLLTKVVSKTTRKFPQTKYSHYRTRRMLYLRFSRANPIVACGVSPQLTGFRCAAQAETQTF